MKYLLILVIALLLIWLWRSGRRNESEDQAPRPDAAEQAHEMVRCAHCGLHLPRSDAVPGQRALYCSPEHRQDAEP